MLLRFLGLSAITSVLTEFRSRKLEVIQIFVCLRRACNLTKRCMSSGKYGKTNYWGKKLKAKKSCRFCTAVLLHWWTAAVLEPAGLKISELILATLTGGRGS